MTDRDFARHELEQIVFDTLVANVWMYDEHLGDSANPDYIGRKQMTKIARAVVAAVMEYGDNDAVL